MSLTSVRDADRRLQCPNAKNTCTNMGCATPGTYTPGIERYEFKGFANIGATSGIPANCCNVRFAFITSTRNPNNTGSGGQNLYVDATVNRCLSVSPCNSSPEFKNDAPVNICGYESLILNYGASDPDLDSLSFAFAPGLQDFGIPITYTPPYAYDKPMPWIGNATGVFPTGISCDPLTGDIMFTPPNSGGLLTGVVVVEVKQWKKVNGITQLMGKTRRDAMMILRGDCLPNNPPRLNTFPYDTDPSISKMSWTTCAGQQLCFTVTGKDTDYNPPTRSDTTYLSWDSTLAPLGATFLPTYTAATRPVNGPREDSYQFCWTPPETMGSTNPYLFTVTSRDNRCPNPGKVQRAFSITVLPKPQLNIVKTDKKCGKWNVSYTKQNTSQVFDSTCIIVNTQPFNYSPGAATYTFPNATATSDMTFTSPGKYLVRVFAKSGSCNSNTYDTLVVDTAVSVKTRDTVACQGIAMTITATAKNGIAPLSYKWYNTIRDTTTTPLNAPNYTVPGLNITTNTPRYYTIVVKDANGCPAIDSVRVLVKNGIQSAVVTPVKCYGDSNGSITVSVVNPTPQHQYKLNNGAFQSSSVFNNLAPGTYTVTVKDTSSCTSTQTYTITQPAVLKDTLTTTAAQLCVGINSGSINTTGKGGTTPYRYSLDSINFDTIHSFTNRAPGVYKIHIRDQNNCYASVTQTVAAADSLKYSVTTQNVKCSGYTNGQITVVASGGKQPYQYKLDAGSFVSSGTFANLSAKTYSVTVKDANACTVVFNNIVTAPAALTQTTVVKNNTCNGGISGSVAIFAAGGTSPYQYKRNAPTYDTVSVFTGLAAGVYSFTIKDNNDCVSNFSQGITQPLVISSTIASQNVTCFGKNDGKITITTTGGTPPLKYSIDSTNFSSVNTFQQLSPAGYRVYVRDSFSCEKVFTTAISQPVKVAATAASIAVSCYNKTDGKITLTPVSGRAPITYSINAGTYSSSPVFNNIGAGAHLISIRDSAGCTDTMTINLANPAKIVAGTISGPSSSMVNATEAYSVPSQTGLNYVWAAEKGTIISGGTTSSMNIRWDSAGTGKLGVIVYSDPTCNDTSTLAVSINNVGLNELSKSWGLQVYPNPTKNMLNITLQQLPEQQIIQLYDMQGKLILKQELKHQQQLNIETLSPGIYMLKIGNWSGQVIKD
jgi:hypothetical protein